MNQGEILRGDCLLYGRTPFLRSPLAWFFGMVINIKTWSKFCHVEIYAGNGLSFASRDGKGVGLYPFRKSELVEVRRPPVNYDHDRAVRWFQTVDGQKYDWLGLLCFTLAVARGAIRKMFCSEFGRRWYRSGLCELFNPAFDSDRVSPAQMQQTIILKTVWKK